MTTRAFLVRYVRTGSLLLAGAVALLVGWFLAAPAGWPAAVAVTGGWAPCVAVWLGRAEPDVVATVSWAAPFAVLAPLGAAGWLTPDGLVFWWPLTALLAVALAVVHHPTRSAHSSPSAR